MSRSMHNIYLSFNVGWQSNIMLLLYPGLELVMTKYLQWTNQAPKPQSQNQDIVFQLLPNNLKLFKKTSIRQYVTTSKKHNKKTNQYVELFNRFSIKMIKYYQL